MNISDLFWQFIFFFHVAFTGYDFQKKAAIPVTGYRLFWQDEFNGRKLNTKKWNYMEGSRRDSYNSKSAVFLDGKGYLHLQAKLSGDSILTGMINTEEWFETRYGYFECRAKLTTTPGIWPAFWLLTDKSARDNSIPETDGVEIDVFEYFINLKRDSVSHNLHWGGYGKTHQEAGLIFAPLKKTSDGFHRFGLEWTDTSYRAYVDGKLTATGTQHISKVKEYLILSVECGKDAAGPLQKSLLPDDFIVDYVRVYKKSYERGSK